MSYNYDRTAGVSMKMGPARLDARATGALQKATLKAKHGGKSLNDAVLSAGFYAKKMKKTMYIYEGNSFMHTVFRVTEKEADCLSPINNTGDQILSVTPELEVSWHSVER